MKDLDAFAKDLQNVWIRFMALFCVRLSVDRLRIGRSPTRGELRRDTATSLFCC